ncbi:NUDIX hydrolase [Gracilibacillus oryzae]|uniref:NUDIX hydrolase n=1 Tax=Gracilibacillus oryzae TaxID=1672701 RepID=A0A7C8GUB5_9BACI|nr:NUDIX hydrolase [Gracilibacillus oryzae]KAB8138081.1 NUDIX hydrolase [Gracilibacillus oryzae]
MGYVEDLRKVVGNQPVILVGVAVGVVNENGEILLQKRSDGRWGVPGGFMELGESAEEAGRREVFEETGLEIGEMELVNVMSGEQYLVRLPNGDEFFPVTIVYLSKEIKVGELKPDGVESLEVNFFSMKELPDELNPLIKNLIHQYL